jgi:hypothetical protein
MFYFIFFALIIWTKDFDGGDDKGNGAKCIKNSDAYCDEYINNEQCKELKDPSDSSKFFYFFFA